MGGQDALKWCLGKAAHHETGIFSHEKKCLYMSCVKYYHITRNLEVLKWKILPQC